MPSEREKMLAGELYDPVDRELVSERTRGRPADRDALRLLLAQTEEAERRRLARELHDQLGQELTALRLGLDEVRRLASAESSALTTRLSQLAAIADRMTTGVRQITLELHPPELDDVGLEAALETYVREWSERYGISADVTTTGLRERAIPPDVSSAVYRIAQEALTNIARHARASHVSVIVDKPDGEVWLIVEDDGRGFDVADSNARPKAERRLGIAGMRERAAVVGGTVTLESAPGEGTTVYVRLPL